MSTTLNREVAMDYALSSGGVGDTHILYEMQMGMVDRGAELWFLSQYPHEKVLWNGE